MSENYEDTDENETGLNWWEMDYEEDVVTYIYDRKTKELVTKIVGVVPDPHEIGLQYGSGEYRAMIRGRNATGNKTITKDFKLGAAYDVKPETAGKTLSGYSAAPVAGGDIAAQVAAGMVQGLQGIFQSFAPVLPSIIEMMKPKEPSFGAALEQNYMSMNRILESNQKRQMENFSEFQKQIMESVAQSMNLTRVSYEEDEDEDEEQEDSPMSILFTMVKPLLAGAMPGIMSGKGAEIIEGIKTNPLFIQVVSNAAVMKEIEQWILSEFGYDALVIVKGLLTN